MSTVLWTNLLVNGQVSTDDSDKPALHAHADKLDAIAQRLELGSFLALCDTTDLRFNQDEFELPAGVTSTNEVMATEGVWMEVRAAVRLLKGLLAHVEEKNVRFGLLSNAHDEVVEELAEALAYARSAPQGASFNFCVVT